jgi:hypothetical protein
MAPLERASIIQADSSAIEMPAVIPLHKKGRIFGNIDASGVKQALRSLSINTEALIRVAVDDDKKPSTDFLPSGADSPAIG